MSITKNQKVKKKLGIHRSAKLGKEIKISQLVPVLKMLKKNKKKIVFTNGCFDLLHPGHLHSLKSAKSYGDVLVVGLNSDSSVKKLKGDHRPIFNQKDRIQALSALEFVDFIVLFSSTSVLPLIQKVQPDVLVKGQDVQLVLGQDFVESYGGIVKKVPMKKGFSTTKLIQKIAEVSSKENQIQKNK